MSEAAERAFVRQEENEGRKRRERTRGEKNEKRKRRIGGESE